jgi:hypothetical protein
LYVVSAISRSGLVRKARNKSLILQCQSFLALAVV